MIVQMTPESGAHFEPTPPSTAAIKPAPVSMIQKPQVMVIVRWPVGGIRTYIRYILSHPDFQAYRYLLVAPDRQEVHDLVTELDRDIELVATQDSTASIANTVARLLFSRPVDLVHSHGFSSGLAAALSARLRGVPHLMTSHDVLQPSQFQGIRGQLKKQALAFNFRLIDCIQSVGHEAQANLESMLSLADKKLTTVVNGVDVQRFANALPRDIRAEQNIASDQLVIGFMGRFMAQKGFIHLVRAIEQLHTSGQSVPTVVAVGSGDFIREDTALIQQKGLLDYFRFIPFESDVGGLLKGIDLLVMPSLWEACPLLPMEAMAAGIPVLGTTCVGLNEVLEQTPNKRLPPADVDALVAALRQYSEPAVLADWQQQARGYQPEALQRFDIHRTAEAVAALYQRWL